MSAGGFVDGCGFVPVSNGTGDFVVSSAITGYQTPASAGAVNATVYSYRAESGDKTQWEIGFGAYTSGTTTLARTTVAASSTGSKVSFTAAPNVYITALTADLQNAALLTGGTLPVARINGGTANQLVQGDGTFQTQGRKLLNTVTVSGGTLSDTTSLSNSAFTEFEFIFEQVVPGTTGVSLLIQLQSGGTFQTTTYLSSILWGNQSTTGSQSNTSGIQVGASSSTLNSAPGLSCDGRISNPASTSLVKVVRTLWHQIFSSTVLISGVTTGYWNGGLGAITGIQIVPSSGTLSSGTLKIYGLS